MIKTKLVLALIFGWGLTSLAQVKNIELHSPQPNNGGANNIGNIEIKPHASTFASVRATTAPTCPIQNGNTITFANVEDYSNNEDGTMMIVQDANGDIIHKEYWSINQITGIPTCTTGQCDRRININAIETETDIIVFTGSVKTLNSEHLIIGSFDLVTMTPKIKAYPLERSVGVDIAITKEIARTQNKYMIVGYLYSTEFYAYQPLLIEYDFDNQIITYQEIFNTEMKPSEIDFTPIEHPSLTTRLEYYYISGITKNGYPDGKPDEPCNIDPDDPNYLRLWEFNPYTYTVNHDYFIRSNEFYDHNGSLIQYSDLNDKDGYLHLRSDYLNNLYMVTDAFNSDEDKRTIGLIKYDVFNKNWEFYTLRNEGGIELFSADIIKTTPNNQLIVMKAASPDLLSNGNVGAIGFYSFPTSDIFNNANRPLDLMFDSYQNLTGQQNLNEYGQFAIQKGLLGISSTDPRVTIGNFNNPTGNFNYLFSMTNDLSSIQDCEVEEDILVEDKCLSIVDEPLSSDTLTDSLHHISVTNLSYHGEIYDCSLQGVQSFRVKKDIDSQVEEPIVFPNPISDMVSIKLENISNEGSAVNIVIYSIDGRVLKSELVNMYKGQVSNFDMSDFASGIYYIKISNLDTEHLEKIIKR